MQLCWTVGWAGLVLHYKPVPTNQQSCEFGEIPTTQPLVPALGISQVRTAHNHYILSVSQQCHQTGKYPDQETHLTINNLTITLKHKVQQWCITPRFLTCHRTNIGTTAVYSACSRLNAPKYDAANDYHSNECPRQKKTTSTDIHKRGGRRHPP